jgi:acetoacetyl-CoA synthetase
MAQDIGRKVTEGEWLWSPRPEFAGTSQVAQYMGWLDTNRQRRFEDYDALWRWSVAEPEDFWASIWAYFDVQSDQPYLRVLDRRVMPGARWFEGSLVNYAEHLLRHEAQAAPG